MSNLNGVIEFRSVPASQTTNDFISQVLVLKLSRSPYNIFAHCIASVTLSSSPMLLQSDFFTSFLLPVYIFHPHSFHRRRILYTAIFLNSRTPFSFLPLPLPSLYHPVTLVVPPSRPVVPPPFLSTPPPYPVERRGLVFCRESAFVHSTRRREENA